MERHNCGGTLRRTQVALTRSIGGLLYTFTVPGKKCSICSEEVISHDTADKLDRLLGRWESSGHRRGRLYTTLNAPTIYLPGTGTTFVKAGPTLETGKVAYTYS